MKKKNIPVEFVIQMFALIIAIIVVHAFYVSVVRPNAAQIIEEQNAAAAADPNYVRERRVAVLIKDLEQEACFILMFWALAIMGYKAVKITRCRGRNANIARRYARIRPPGATVAGRGATNAAAARLVERAPALQFDAQHPGCLEQHEYNLRIRG
jgi:hypothetical protein